MSNKLYNIDGLTVPYVDERCKHVFHQYTLKINNNIIPRKKIENVLSEKEIVTGIYYPTPIHKQPLYLKLGYNNSFPISEKLSTEVLSLPVHPGLNSSELDIIIETIKEMYE